VTKKQAQNTKAGGEASAPGFSF
ncbi:MAG: hypothetical protein RJB02_128, partial [Pseudomonadota bacterium]